MRQPCVLLLLLLLAAGASAGEGDERIPPPETCDELRVLCKNGCSMDFGSSVSTRDKLVTCIARCDERHDICLLRNVALRQVAPASSSERKRASPPVEEMVTPYMLPPTRYSGPEPGAPPSPEPAAEGAAPIPRGATSVQELPSADADARPTSRPLVEESPAAGTPRKTGAPAKKGPKGAKKKPAANAQEAAER